MSFFRSVPVQIGKDGASGSLPALSSACGSISGMPTSASDQGRRRYLSDGVSDDVIEGVEGVSALLSLGPANELLRASQLTLLMRRGAAIYGSSAGSAETYTLSEKVTEIDFFVSHNWIVSRWGKYVALSVYFNNSIAVAVVVVYCIALVALGWSGLLPLCKLYGRSFALVGEFTVVPMYFAALFGCRDVMHMCGIRSARSFLDKTCIHQVDKNLQRMGIEKLAAFLKSSKQMVILFSRQYYFRKLWTVYEVAAFLSLHPADRMIVLPLARNVSFVVVLLACYVYQLLTVPLTLLLGNDIAFAVLGYPLGCAVMLSNRRWLRERDRMIRNISDFKVQECGCFCEEDRPVVYRNICLLMRASGISASTDSDGDALEAFSNQVRTTVCARVLASSSCKSFSYIEYLCIGIALVGGSVSDTVAVVKTDREKLVWTIFHLFWITTGWPGMAKQCEWVSSSKTHLVGGLELLWVTVGCMIWLFVMGCVLLAGTGYLGTTGVQGSDACLAALIAITALGAATFRWSCKRAERASSSTSHDDKLQFAADGTSMPNLLPIGSIEVEGTVAISGGTAQDEEIGAGRILRTVV